MMASNNQMARKLRRRMIYSFCDLLILAKLRHDHPMSCSDIIGFVHREFDITVSPGTVYAHLYSLEQNELITGHFTTKKYTRAQRVYRITEKGKETISKAAKQQSVIQNTVAKILKG